MRSKFFLLFSLALIMIFNIVACTDDNENVELSCDGEDCDNLVSISGNEDKTPDDSWVVFCDECAKNLND